MKRKRKYFRRIKKRQENRLIKWDLTKLSDICKKIGLFLQEYYLNNHDFLGNDFDLKM